MCDEWMPQIELPLTLEQLRRLPRNAAYKYEYIGGQAFLSPRPRFAHALLDLKVFQPSELVEPVSLRRVKTEELSELTSLFTAAFSRVQPYGSLDETTRQEAARKSLARTQAGGDGPLIEPACFVAEEEGQRVGAILITLLPAGDPCEWNSFYWSEPPPADCVERRLGRPHLTWVFVSPLLAGRGVGTALLAVAVRALLDLGYEQLASTFLVGNETSMLWHWRNGFRLLAAPDSKRELWARLRKRQV